VYMCGGGVGPYFVVFAEECRGTGPKQNNSLLEWGVRGPGTEVISTKSAGKTEDDRVRKGG